MIIEFSTKVYNLKDSATSAQLKTLKSGETPGVLKPGGEKRLHFCAVPQRQEYDSFFFPNGNKDVVCEFSKIDLLRYLESAKTEFMNPIQKYRMPIRNYYDELYATTLCLKSDFYKVRFVPNVDAKRYYLARPTGDEFYNNYNFLINICLPYLTDLVFIRTKDENNEYKFTLKPEFKCVISTNMLSNFQEDNSEDIPLQKIYFGGPGTGKSHKVKELTKANDPSGNHTFRTTFHPDYDYASFVGVYKPVPKGDDITYSFVPQTFTNAYVDAWLHPESKVFLVIEEINRGNCAQIFGDLFQLLDRDDSGVSEYPIDADEDLKAHLIKKLGPDSEGIKGGKLKLPSNLHIFATMNTSDQSLFPMDSAFKRRWQWEYESGLDAQDKANFKITIGKREFSWLDFVNKINTRILEATSSEDKQIGPFFIKSDIGEEEFKSKVMFYLWSEVCKENFGTQDNFMEALEPVPESKEIFLSNTSPYQTDPFTFNDLYGQRAEDLLLGFLYKINVFPTNEEVIKIQNEEAIATEASETDTE